MTCGHSVASQEKGTARRFRGASRSTMLCDGLPRGKTSKLNALANMALSQKTTKLYLVPLISRGYRWGRSPVVGLCSVQEGYPGGSIGRGQGCTHPTVEILSQHVALHPVPIQPQAVRPDSYQPSGSGTLFRTLCTHITPSSRTWFGPPPWDIQACSLTLALCAHLDWVCLPAQCQVRHLPPSVAPHVPRVPP